MERYLNDNPFLDARMQTMQVTLQFGEYKGIFQKEFGGDVLGLHILSSLCSGVEDPEFYVGLTANDCNLKILYGVAISNNNKNCEQIPFFKCSLRNKNGEVMELERELPDIQELVVAVEIVKSEIDHNPPSGGTWKK